LIFRECTSSGTFLPRGRDKIIRDIEKRVADFSFIPVYVVSTSLLSISLLVYLVDTSGINDAFDI